MARKAKHTTEETKATITDAFLELYADERLDKITVGAIISKAHVTRSTFYYHYRDVYDLLEKTEDELFDNYIESVLPYAMLSIVNNDFTTYVSVIDSAFEQYKHKLKIFMVTKADARFTNKLKAYARSQLLKQIGITGDDMSIEQKLVLEYIVNAMYGTLTWWIANDKPISISEILEIANRINTQGPLTVLKS
jgi:Transcriptional regulator